MRLRHRRLLGELSGRSRGDGRGGRDNENEDEDNDDDGNVGDNGEGGYDGGGKRKGGGNYNGNVGSVDSGMRRGGKGSIPIPVYLDNLPPL